MRLPRSIPGGRNGFTLIELMVVITIIGIMTAVMIPEMKGSFQDELLRSSGRDLINVFDLAYSRAVSLNQTRRVLLEGSTGQYRVEKQVQQGGLEVFVTANDVPGNEGKLDARITAEFRPGVGAMAEAGVVTEPAESASDLNEAVISFYPDGTADAGTIILRDKAGYQLGLQINPVTARVRVVEMQREGPS